MGAVHSRTSRAAEFDVRELHGIAFRRALRKQDRRLERDAAALRRRRGGESGPSRRRERDERPRVNDGDDGIPIPIVAHEAARRFRRDTNEREEDCVSGDDRTETERRRAAEEMRALRLECARREAKARQRREAEREKRRADRRRRGDDENDGAGNGENGSRFDELLAACAADEARHAARSASKRRRERERRREASERRASPRRETSPGDEDERLVFQKNENDSSAYEPCDALPFAAAAAAAAADERRTGSLNPPGASRGGLKRKYEQVKVFRNGDSLFQCAFLAELVSRHEDDVFSFEDDVVNAFDRRDRAATRRAETVAAVLRRGIRALGSADTHETTLALRAGAASRIAEAHVDARADGAPPGANPPPTLRDDFDVDAIDAAVVTAVNGAELLNKNMRLCPPRGAPLDTWRRAMNEVGRRAEAELPEEAADALLDDDERLESDPGRVATSGAPDDEASRLERRAAFESAVRNVRRAYADEVARARVPSSSLEVAALAAHLRRPIAVIRGPSRPPRAAKRESNPSAEGADDEIGEADASPASAWRARCASETFGAAHARRGRRGFTVFWELAENVPDGLPAGDFSLLLPRRETNETNESRVEGRERFSSSRGRRRSFAASDDDTLLSSSVSSFVASSEEEGEYAYPPNARATFSGADTLTDDADVSDVSDVSDADVSVSSVDDLLRGHAFRSRRFAESGFWSDRTPLASDSDTGGSIDVSVSGESLWNSESERSFDLSGSESERDGERRRETRRDAPSFLDE